MNDNEAKVGADPYAAKRAALLAEVDLHVRETERYLGRDRLSSRVRGALATTPRERFVPAARRREAYANRPLPIGQGQTISQPYIVAVMTDLLEFEPGARVLEIGTGCGYQTAVLTLAGAKVFSIERIASLAEAAKARLTPLDLGTVRLRVGDGIAGWPEEAPFAGVLVTAAAPSVPEALVAQLAPGGVLVVPVGPAGGAHWLHRIEKRTDGSLEDRRILPVAFVPLLPGTD